MTTHAKNKAAVESEATESDVRLTELIAAALVAILEVEESTPRLHERISRWGKRERIPAHRFSDEDGDPVGPKRSVSATSSTASMLTAQPQPSTRQFRKDSILVTPVGDRVYRAQQGAPHDRDRSEPG